MEGGTSRYSHLCDLVAQLSGLIEPEFMKEVAKLETDMASARLDVQRMRRTDPKTAEALSTTLNEIEKVLGKIWEAKDMPSMKGTLALIEAWPTPNPPLKRVGTIIRRASLIADKARVRTNLLSMLEYCCEPVRDEVS